MSKNREYYVFKNSGLANAAVNYINAKAKFPFRGKNKKTGEVNENRPEMTTWQTPFQRLTDGKWCLMRVPLYLRNAFASQSEQEEFDLTMPHAVEDIQDDWLVE